MKHQETPMPIELITYNSNGVSSNLPLADESVMFGISSFIFLKVRVY